MFSVILMPRELRAAPFMPSLRHLPFQRAGDRFSTGGLNSYSVVERYPWASEQTYLGE